MAFGSKRPDINEVLRNNRTDLRLFHRLGIGWSDGVFCPVDPNEFIVIDDDFVNMPCDDTTNLPTNLIQVADAGATGVTGPASAVVGSHLQIYADGDDNDEAYVRTRGAPFKFLTNRICVFGAQVKHTDPTTAGKSGFYFGLGDITAIGAANTIPDTGAAPVTTFDGAIFFKAEDGANIVAYSSNGAVQSSALTIATYVSATTFWLEAFYDYNDGITGKFYWFCDGVYIGTQNLTISGMDATMALSAGEKHFASAAAEASTLIDRWYAIQPK